MTKNRRNTAVVDVASVPRMAVQNPRITKPGALRFASDSVATEDGVKLSVKMEFLTGP